MTSHHKASLAWMTLMCLSSTISHAQLPKAQEHNAYQAIIPLTVVPYPCVSVQGHGARILLSRNDLVALSTSDAKDSTEPQQRLAFLAVQRAKELLAKVSSTQDDSGCAMAILAKHADLDALYVVSYLLEQGKAAVMRDGKHTPELQILVGQSPGPAMCMENFEFSDGKVFFSVLTWVV